MVDSSWEQAVRRYRADPQNTADVLANYFDLPVAKAAQRFACSDEFREVTRLLAAAPGRTVLDFGAGNGIASYALLQAGWRVTALEPDPSAEIGAGAIRSLSDQIQVVQQSSLPLPFATNTFDAIHARQVLHHVPDLTSTLADLARVVRSRGIVLATREHVISRDEDRQTFLDRHPLHRLYGGENAYVLRDYTSAFSRAGLHLRGVWGPTETIINFFPGSELQRRKLVDRVGRGAGRWLRRLPRFEELAWRWMSFRDRTPGRLYTFLAVKP